MTKSVLSSGICQKIYKVLSDIRFIAQGSIFPKVIKASNIGIVITRTNVL